METLKDMWASIVDYSKERGSNPLTAAFVLGWCFWNYKFLVLLFSAESPSKTFSAIDAIYSAGYTRWLSGLLYPMLTAIFYVFAYPYVTERVLKFYRRRQIEISNEIKKIEAERIRSPEEVARIVRRYEKNIEGLNKEIGDLRVESDALRLALQQQEGTPKGRLVPGAEIVGGAESGEAIENENQMGETDGAQKITVALDTSMKLVHEKSTVEDGPGIPAGILGTYSRLDLSILSTLIENPGFNVSMLCSKLKVARYWVEESLAVLIEREFVSARNGSLHVRELGRAVLRALVDQGKIQIQVTSPPN